MTLHWTDLNAKIPPMSKILRWRHQQNGEDKGRTGRDTLSTRNYKIGIKSFMCFGPNFGMYYSPILVGTSFTVISMGFEYFESKQTELVLWGVREKFRD